MADKKIKVQVDVETDVEPSIAALKALKKQLKDTAAGTEDFARLQQQIDDVQDSLVAARKGAGNFTDVLSGLPGPLGAIGGQASGLITTLKQFGQLKMTDIKSSFVELGRDLVDVAKGIGNLTGLTKVYTIINGALAKSFIAVGIGEQAAAVGARAFSAALIATGIGALVVLLGEAAAMMYEMATGTKAAAAAADRLNSALESQNRLLDLNKSSAANRNKVTLAQMKAAGKSEAEIRKYQIDQSYNAYTASHEAEVEARALYNKNLGKADEAGLKALGDNLAKREQETKDARATYLETGYNAKADEIKAEQAANKELAGKQKQQSDKILAEKQRELDELKKQREAALLEISKGEEDAFKATLTERERTEYEINEKYSTLVASATKYGQDTKLLETGRQAELKTMTDKFNQEDADKKKELDEKEKERLTRKAEDERGIILTGLQAEFEVLDRANKQSDLDFEQDMVRFADQRNILAEMEKTDLQNEELTEFQKTEIRKKYADQRTAISDSEIATERAAMQAKHDINMAYLGLFQQFGNLLGQLAGKNKAIAIAGIVISQAASIGQIIAQTSIANAKSVAASPLTFGMPWVAINTISAGLSIASTIAGAAKSIQQINSQPGAAASNAGAGGGGGAAMPSAPRVGGMMAPTINTTGGQNATSQIADTLAAASGKPIKAYVVGGDVTSQQALDRRTNRAATFSGQ